MELEVRVWASSDRVHVSVLDERPDRAVYRAEADAEAATGRGMGLVEALASDFGVDFSESTKTVSRYGPPWKVRSPPGSGRPSSRPRREKSSYEKCRSDCAAPPNDSAPRSCAKPD